MTNLNRCWYCGAIINGLRRDAHFCNPSQKAAFHKLAQDEKNRRKTLYGGILSVAENSKPEQKKLKPEKSITAPPETTQALEQLLNTISTNGNEDTSSLDGAPDRADNNRYNKKDNTERNNTNGSANEILPDEFIIKTTTADNPKYLELADKLKIYAESILKSETEITRVKNQIKSEQNRNGTGYVVGGAGTGGFLVNQISKSAHSEYEGLLTVLGMLGGGLIGSALKSETQKSRDQVKQKNIQNLNILLATHEAELTSLKGREAWLNFKLLCLEKTITTETKEKNPAFDTAVKNNPVNNLSGINNNRIDNGKINSAKNISEMNHQLLNLTGKWEKFLGKLQTNFLALIHGMSGGGKSHLALQFIVYLCQRFGNGKGLYISGEEGFAPTFQQKLKTLGADKISNLDIADLRHGEEILKSIPNTYHFIFIDSLNTMNIDVLLLRAIRAKFPQSAIICIGQNTKAGLLRGNGGFRYDSDVVIEVNNGIAVTTKNRFKEIGMEFNVFDVYGK
jgi:hypothetical protein